jgi:hypothetical protein
VAPAWRSLKFAWDWLDADDRTVTVPAEDLEVNEAALCNSPAWWEDFVQAVKEREGRLNMQ